MGAATIRGCGFYSNKYGVHVARAHPRELRKYYWQSLNLAVLAQMTFLISTIGGFKIGGMVQYRHTYMHTGKKFGGF